MGNDTRDNKTESEHVETIVIGGGQAGLAMGYHLRQKGMPFVILDANERVGHAWRRRWDSLRLFTPGYYTSLPGMRFPGKRNVAPTKDEMAAYLEQYAATLELPVKMGIRVDGLSRDADRDVFVVTAGRARFTAHNVVVATGAFNNPWTPPFASELDARIVQFHSQEYHNASQLAPGGVLLVGAGNSGSDIALDVARTHPTWLAGRHPGHVPFRIEGKPTRHLVHVVRFVAHHVFKQTNPIGRRVVAKLSVGGDPVVRVKPKDIAAAGVERVPRVEGVRDGLPLLADGRTLNVSNVIWCTGYRKSFGWIDLPVFSAEGAPNHARGVVESEPGLYFMGLEFQYAATSDVITGVGRDAEYVAKHLATRRRAGMKRREAQGTPSPRAAA